MILFNRKTSKLCIFVIIVLILPIKLFGQNTLTLQSDIFYTSPGALIYVNGDITNNHGSFTHYGDLELTGDWINADTSKVFDNAGNGTVTLAGATQTIQGNTTTFPGLTLAGTGVKILAVNTNVNDTLDLQDHVLMLNGNDLQLYSPITTSIQRAGGYVNTSTNKTGHLIWNVASGNSYLFPMGADGPGRYRPLYVRPENNGTVAAQFMNYDPEMDGYERRKMNGNFNDVNYRFYHTLYWVNGSGYVNVAVPYNSDMDSLHNALAYWGPRNNDWELTQNYQETAQINEGTDRIALGQMNDTGTTALALAHFIDNEKIFIASAFSPNGDGVNDVFFVGGLQNFRNNEVEIFNRWGQMIFNEVGYRNDWRGDGLDVGVYMYIVRMYDAEGIEHVFKGNVTLIR
jgi:gliding motility-associated-like protein